MRAFAIDLSRCVGCYCCQIACKDEHVGNDWTPWAKPQPETGQGTTILGPISGTRPRMRSWRVSRPIVG